MLCLFAEGTRSPDGELMKPQPGLGMVALKSRAPVVPVALVGTDQLLPRHSPLMRPARVRIVIGEPMTFDDLYDQGGREGVEQVGERVMAAIAELQKTGRDLQKSG